ncbi:MAG: uroporphyrinogen decarboxylase [Candidatus Zixiibacteriota bacterium]
MTDYDFIKAAYGQPHGRIPVWIMRQAGRYLPEYQAVKAKHSFMDICRSPELMAEVTTQPIDVLGFDAAIIFSDILLPLQPLGIEVEFTDAGPRLNPLVANGGDVARLRFYDPARELGAVLEGISLARRRLQDRVPLLGFCGAPFTMAYYAAEGRSSLNDNKIKRFIFEHPDAAEDLLQMLAEIIGHYLKAQIDAGADAVQLFDSRGGILSPDDYQKYSLPFINRVFEICRTEGVPRILYLNNSAPYLKYLADVDCEVIGIDWRTDLAQARETLGGKALQGNLDPHLLFASPSNIEYEVRRILKAVGEDNGFIFNLGHGILPQTPVDNVRLLVETVHAYRKNQSKIKAAS